MGCRWLASGPPYGKSQTNSTPIGASSGTTWVQGIGTASMYYFGALRRATRQAEARNNGRGREGSPAKTAGGRLQRESSGGVTVCLATGHWVTWVLDHEDPNIECTGVDILGRATYQCRAQCSGGGGEAPIIGSITSCSCLNFVLRPCRLCRGGSPSRHASRCTDIGRRNA